MQCRNVWYGSQEPEEELKAMMKMKMPVLLKCARKKSYQFEKDAHATP